MQATGGHRPGFAVAPASVAQASIAPRTLAPLAGFHVELNGYRVVRHTDFLCHTAWIKAAEYRMASNQIFLSRMDGFGDVVDEILPHLALVLKKTL